MGQCQTQVSQLCSLVEDSEAGFGAHGVLRVKVVPAGRGGGTGQSESEQPCRSALLGRAVPPMSPGDGDAGPPTGFQSGGHTARC